MRALAWVVMEPLGNIETRMVRQQRKLMSRDKKRLGTATGMNVYWNHANSFEFPHICWATVPWRVGWQEDGLPS